jgi:transposase InsO family protein
LKDLAGARVRYGYRRLHILLMREGWQINHKRVDRLYKQEGLSLRLKTKKKRVSEARVPMPAPGGPNECWSMDFVADRLSDGRQSFHMMANLSRKNLLDWCSVSPLRGACCARANARALAHAQAFRPNGLFV